MENLFMPDIAPFKAFYYNVKSQEELERLVAPPHDVISSAERSVFLQKDPDNIVQIILPDSYPKAGEVLDSLIARGRLVQHNSPTFYLYRTKTRLKTYRL